MRLEKKVVEKVWGSEEWIVNREYCGKFLNLRKGYQCSLHSHRDKDETFYLLEGRVFLELEGERIVMVPGDVELIEPGQQHRFTGLEDSKIIEFSTHHEDEDTYRALNQESRKVDLSKIKY